MNKIINIENQTDKKVFLISAEAPGCGSTTVANLLKSSLTKLTGNEPYFVSMGGTVRNHIGVNNEAELAKSLDKIPDPMAFDRPFYDAIPQDNFSIIEGKKATKIGPSLIKEGTNIVSIDLQTALVTSAIRVMKREGHKVSDLFRKPESMLDYIENVQKRTKHISTQKVLNRNNEREGVANHIYDTSNLHPREIVGSILSSKDWTHSMPEWELEALSETVENLYSMSMHMDTHTLDKEHFTYSLRSIEYNMKQMKTNTNELGLGEIRDDLKKFLIHGAYSLLMKNFPRFFRSTKNDNKLSIDHLSHKWSPEYYKIANAWSTLKKLCRDKNILDPFAGSGTFMNILAARDIPHKVVYGDLCYTGGETLNGGGYQYEPVMNTAISMAIFDNLPSWYKPNFKNKIGGYVTLNSKRLPFADNSFDYVVTDPPYGKNLNDGSLEFFLSVLPELNRVSRNGGIYMIPECWKQELNKIVEYSTLTSDLSHGSSNFPICLIHIPN